MNKLTIKTSRKDQVIDITDQVERALRKSKIENGVCILFAQHTTCALTTADLDTGTDLDFLEFVRAMVPKINFRHPHDPAHTPDHILSTLIGPSVALPFERKKLILGTWQRVVLIELNGQRERRINISFIVES